VAGPYALPEFFETRPSEIQLVMPVRSLSREGGLILAPVILQVPVQIACADTAFFLGKSRESNGWN